MPPEVSLLDGVLERVTFANPETGYTIARIGSARGTRGGSDLITVVGPLLGAQVGESLRMRGRWTSHPKYGKQFEVHSYTTVLPATTQGIQRYLGSGLIKGIGPVMAERMVAHFGVDIMHVIESSPGRLIEVEGLGPKRTAMITAALGRAEGDQGGDGVPAGGGGVHLAGGADLQEVRRRRHLRGARRAVPAGRRRVGHRLQDGRHHRRRGRHRPRQPGTDQGRAGVHPVRGGRRGTLLPARAQPDDRRGQDPRGASTS